MELNLSGIVELNGNTGVELIISSLIFSERLNISLD